MKGNRLEFQTPGEETHFSSQTCWIVAIFGKASSQNSLESDSLHAYRFFVAPILGFRAHFVRRYQVVSGTFSYNEIWLSDYKISGAFDGGQRPTEPVLIRCSSEMLGPVRFNWSASRFHSEIPKRISHSDGLWVQY